jgi:signal transduction histidine kinase
MGQMAAVIAHEVRNPLAIIKATAERIRKKYETGKPDQLLDFISEEVDRLNQTTNRYLQFAAPPEVSNGWESVADIVDSVVGGLRRQFSHKGVNLQKAIDPDLQQVAVNSAKLRQILINLLRNALEATAEAGTLTLKATGSQPPGSVQIEVRDNGCGLGKRELAHIFDPFYTTKPKGSGLGLFVVKRLVEELGGRLVVQSQVGVGTTFTVSFKGKIDG